MASLRMSQQSCLRIFLNSSINSLLLPCEGRFQGKCNLLFRTMSSASTSPSSSEISSLPKVMQTNKPTKQSDRAMKINRAMRAYLERAKEYDEFMKKENAEFEIGRRHLANMMGKNADDFHQEDIDKAIEYLMPSGLFEKRARPMLKPPKEIFPEKKAAQFDYAGRPFHCFFYTGKPNFCQVLHDTAVKMESLNKYEDGLIAKGIKHAERESQIYLKGSDWLSKDEFEKKMIEKINDQDYKYFVASMIRLANHPYSKREEDFIMNFRRQFTKAVTVVEIPPLNHDENRRPYVTATGKRKWAAAEVTVRGFGSGKVEINGQDISYFDSIQCREQVMFPLQFTNLLDEVDIEATVRDSGPAAQAGAIRYALSLALRSFLTKDEVEKMRLAGLLTWDPRLRERKKYGQKGARAKYTWKKR